MRRYTAAVVVVSATLLSSASAFAQFVQQGSDLIGTGAAGKAAQGRAAALSSDGNTAIIGGNQDDSNAGAVWIFVRNGTSWTQQGSKLVGSGSVGSANQGWSVGLSADGNTAIVGGPIDNGNAGAAWIFARSNGTWTQQGEKLVGSGSTGNANQGWSVGLSADGNTAIVGGPSDNAFVGAAWVFTRTGATWSQQGSKLAGTGVADMYADQGFGVALSADGNTALVGGPEDHSGAGAMWAFIRSNGTWAQQGSKLTGTGASGSAAQGHVAISADGRTAALCGDGDNGSTGACWIFTRSGGTWTQQGAKLVGSGASGSPVYQGASASLSSNGNVLIEGGYGDDGLAGASWVFVRAGGAWTQDGAKLVGIGALPGSNGSGQGMSTALSSDGLTVLVGGWNNNDSEGAAWVFTRPLPTRPPHATADFDGDGEADATLFTSNGDWSTLTSLSSFASSRVVHWSAAGYVPLRGDFDGDGREDPAIYNPVTGNWRILKSSSNYTQSVVLDWGGAGYSAVPGDYDGDGKTDPAVYNLATGTWFILKSSTGYQTTMTVGFGGAGYTPIPGQDFDGDLVADIAVYQPSTGVWSVLKSSTADATGFSVAWGGAGYTLVPGDYDGDHRTDLGLYQRATGGWYILTSSSGFTNTITASWGGPGYEPVPGDYDGDGKIDLGVYQASTGNWYALKSATGYTSTLMITGWGSGSDAPISAAIVTGTSELLHDGDFDADGRSEITVYNAASGVWSSLTSSSGFAGATNRNWGGSGYQAVPGDYDGDGRTDLGLYQTATGNWYVLLSSTNFTTSLTESAGGAGWDPAPGDYDGDGKTDFVVYNHTTGQWYGLESSGNYTTAISLSYGGASYFPVPADYDGDGRTDIGVYEGNSGTWSILLSSTNYTTSLSKSVGGPGYTPVPADYDGDGKADFVVYGYLGSGLWYGLLSSTNYTTTIDVSWGGTNYMPVMGDYDGDGKADLATYVQSTGMWYILLSGAHYTTTLSKNWGGAGYIAVPSYPTLN